MTAIVGIACDGCGRTFARKTFVQASIGPVRADASREGWHKGRTGSYVAVNGQSYGYRRDICPECWAAGTR